MMDFAGVEIKHEQAAFTGSRHDHANMGDDMSLAGMTVVITLASLIGFWGLTCLASGLVKSGGAFGLAAAWISSVFGF